MEAEYHIACLIAYGCIGVRLCVVEKLVDCLLSGDGGLRLLGCDGSECWKHCGIDCSSIVEQRSSDLLDAFDTLLW